MERKEERTTNSPSSPHPKRAREASPVKDQATSNAEEGADAAEYLAFGIYRDPNRGGRIPVLSESSSGGVSRRELLVSRFAKFLVWHLERIF